MTSNAYLNGLPNTHSIILLIYGKHNNVQEGVSLYLEFNCFVFPLNTNQSEKVSDENKTNDLT